MPFSFSFSDLLPRRTSQRRSASPGSSMAYPTTAEGPTPSKMWIMGTEAFERRMEHHDGIKQLWETKWRFPNNINDGTSPEYTEAFFPVAASLSASGDQALASGDKTLASTYYLRAACVLRIARFPYITGFPSPNCPVKWRAWEEQKRVYMKAGALWESPVEEAAIPFSYAAGLDRHGTDDPAGIPAYVRVPRSQATAPGGCPVVILITGLDGYRPDNTVRCDEFLARGWASVVVEIPGTADCPADPADPASPDRMWESVLEWMTADGRFDMGRVMVWGLSSGGYYAIRIAHTHADRLVGVVAQGAGCHYFFDREWLDKADGHEYPFKLTPALAMKHGFESVEAYKEEAQKRFSLLDTGILQKPSTRLLLINGTLDGLMPIEDSMLLFEHGSPKEARFFPGALHMGYPMANGAVYPWMESIMESVKKA